MGFFRRDEKPPEPPEAPAGYTYVHEDDIGGLVDQLTERTVALYPIELPDALDICQTLAAVEIIGEDRARALGGEGVSITRSLCNLGYASRIAEVQWGELDEAVPYLTEGLLSTHGTWAEEWWATMHNLTGTFARGDPADSMPGDEHALSWEIPGVGSQVRTKLAQNLALSVIADEYEQPVVPEGITFDELTRCCKFGYFLRCMEQSLPEGATI